MESWAHAVFLSICPSCKNKYPERNVKSLARKPRIWYPGAMYHIISRGNRKSALFYDDQDLQTYLTILEKTKLKFPFYLHAYCLMTNHTHLQLETMEHPISDIMKRINSLYAIYFNKRHDLNGHVFQGRFGSRLIETRGYLLDVSRYIHLNPVEAEMVSRPEDYPWSSYRSYITGEADKFVTIEKILSQFPTPAEKHYQVFVEAGWFRGCSTGVCPLR